MKVISRGAEAILYKEDGKLIKERIKKKYRIEEIDEKLRRFRTQLEMKLINHARRNRVNVPIIHDNTKYKLIMQEIKGNTLREDIDKLKNPKNLFIEIGEQISKMHNGDIIHGDLTTSNVILQKGKPYFIDFGLGFVSSRIEDKATDLRLFKKALESKHSNKFKKYWQWVLEGYMEKSNKPKHIMNRLRKIELRGRYKERTEQPFGN